MNLLYELFLIILIIVILCSGEENDLANTINDKAIKAHLTGFHTHRSRIILNSLLSNPVIDIVKTFNNYEVQLLNVNENQPKLFISNDMTYSDYDLSFIFIDSSNLLDENLMIERFQSSYKSVIASKNKSPIIIVFTGLAENADKVEYLLKESWLLLDKDEYFIKDESLFTKFDVQIILTPYDLKENESVNPEAIKAVVNAIEVASSNRKPIDECFNISNINTISYSNHNNKTNNGLTKLKLTENGIHSNTVEGIEIVPIAVNQALDWALKATNDSIIRLNRLETPESFAGFIDNLLKASKEVLIKYLDEQTTNVGTSKSIKALAEKELMLKVLTRLSPLYKRQIQLLRNEIANQFNEYVTNQLEVSIYIMEDLQTARDNTLYNFTQCIARITPKHVIKTRWNADFEIYELKQTLNDYLDSRESFYRLAGVLSRDNKIPIDISFHILALHPFGRDYRQDVLGSSTYNSKDRLVYDSNLSKYQSKQIVTVPPLIARKQLQQYLIDNKNIKNKKKLEINSEFAREMLMFPLSIKNPDVPMSSGRTTKRKSSIGTLFKSNELRATEGPERYMYWNVKPMDEIKMNLDNIIKNYSPDKQLPIKSQSALKSNQDSLLNVFGSIPSVDKIIDDTLNILPVFNKGYYIHPPINYGNKYNPSTHTTVSKSA